MSGLKNVIEILKSTYLDPFHLLFCLFSPLAALFLLRSGTRLSPGVFRGPRSGCWDSGLLVSTTAVAPDGVVLRDMSSRNGVEEPK